MDLFRRIFLIAGLAGLLAGLAATAAHTLATVPLILEAERYEEAVPHGHGAGDEWRPADGAERAAFTALADVVTAVGFALLLVSAYALRGAPVGWREGLGWGLAGFATFTLAPALGLPPELPGAEAGPLLARQAWWLTTAAATGGGLALILLVRRPAWALAGVLLLLLPHLHGAPQPLDAHHAAAAVPEDLARTFVAAAVATGLALWLALGFLTGLLYQRLAPPEAAA